MVWYGMVWQGRKNPGYEVKYLAHLLTLTQNGR